MTSLEQTVVPTSLSLPFITYYSCSIKKDFEEIKRLLLRRGKMLNHNYLPVYLVFISFSIGNIYLQTTFKCRDRIAEIGAPFIRDGTVQCKRIILSVRTIEFYYFHRQY